ncbi:unnamed protein product [Prorocentrum cordatum]|uniref:J domain-containing protein n=1 Tax=Prorocentrum cordatum TaxID=2364126 RepID=A0ABN9Q8E6_9DINO|nr:unnamed protein product [Polarella glacialis]
MLARSSLAIASFRLFGLFPSWLSSSVLPPPLLYSRVPPSSLILLSVFGHDWPPLQAFKLTIRDAFKALALEHHPDKGGDPEKFKAIRASCGALLAASAAARPAPPAPVRPASCTGDASPKAQTARSEPPARRRGGGGAAAGSAAAAPPRGEEQREAPPAANPQLAEPRPAAEPTAGQFYLAACGGRRGVVEVKSIDSASGSMSVQWYAPYRNPRVGGEACLRRAARGAEAQVQPSSIGRPPVCRTDRLRSTGPSGCRRASPQRSRRAAPAARAAAPPRCGRRRPRPARGPPPLRGEPPPAPLQRGGGLPRRPRRPGASRNAGGSTRATWRRPPKSLRTSSP